MITLQAHIDTKYDGNISAFASAHNRSRPLVYRLIKSGAIWHDGQAFDPVTKKPAATDPTGVRSTPTLANVMQLLADMDKEESRTVVVNHKGRAELVFEVTAADARAMLAAQEEERPHTGFLQDWADWDGREETKPESPLHIEEQTDGS